MDVLCGEPSDVLPGFAKELGAVAVVTDMCPLRDSKRRTNEVAEELTNAGDKMPLFEVGGAAAAGPCTSIKFP